jgi:hypothetical protein
MMCQQHEQLQLLVKLLRQLITCKSKVIASITSCTSYSRRCKAPCKARGLKGATIPKGIEKIVRRKSATKRRIEGGCLLLLG